jgi:hypothetical protein
MAALHLFLSHQHARLDTLLEESLRDGVVNAVAYDEFRRLLLRHIAIEEKVLFREVRRRVGTLNALEAQLRKDHAAIGGLMVLPPTAAVILRVRALLAEHNPLEELDGGFYTSIEALVGTDAEALLAEAQAIPPAKVADYFESPRVHQWVDLLVREAAEQRYRIPVPSPAGRGSG